MAYIVIPSIVMAHVGRAISWTLKFMNICYMTVSRYSLDVFRCHTCPHV